MAHRHVAFGMSGGPINPVLNFDHASTTETILYGLCMGLAAIFVGWVVLLAGSPVWRRRRIVLLVGAFMFMVGGCIISSRDYAQAMRERMEERREQQRTEETQLNRDDEPPAPRRP